MFGSKLCSAKCLGSFWIKVNEYTWIYNSVFCEFTLRLHSQYVHDVVNEQTDLQKLFITTNIIAIPIIIIYYYYGVYLW